MSGRVLIAGIGNLFFRDDGFGVEVARRLTRCTLPPGVIARDFGIRGVHLAFELLAPTAALVVVDALARGADPGTLSVVEPELEPSRATRAGDAHGMDLPTVLASVRSMGGELPRVLLVGCEPEVVDEGIGLSVAVERAVPPAVALVHDVVGRLLASRAAAP